MPEFFETRFSVLKGPFSSAQFASIRQKQWKLHHEIGVYVRTGNSQAPFCDLYIPTGKKDLAPFGRKVVTGFSLIIMTAITYAGYINLVR